MRTDTAPASTCAALLKVAKHAHAHAGAAVADRDGQALARLPAARGGGDDARVRGAARRSQSRERSAHLLELAPSVGPSRPYKPVYIDLENPADFTYYFDTCGRRRCYLAPERFVAGAAAVRARARDSHVTAAMDVFSVGCTVAELLSHGAAVPVRGHGRSGAPRPRQCCH